MVQTHIKEGVLELCYRPYRNPWFMVPKKDTGYRLINAAIEINKYTVRDANMPPNVEEFSKEFAG